MKIVGNVSNEYIVFCYDEAFLTHNEYEQHIHADYIVNAIGLYRMHDPKEELSYKLALEILYKD